MNKYEAACKISMPRAGFSPIPLLPLALRAYQKLGPDAHFFRLHDAQNARQASWSAAVEALLLRGNECHL